MGGREKPSDQYMIPLCFVQVMVKRQSIALRPSYYSVVYYSFLFSASHRSLRCTTGLLGWLVGRLGRQIPLVCRNCDFFTRTVGYGRRGTDYQLV